MEAVFKAVSISLGYELLSQCIFKIYLPYNSVATSKNLICKFTIKIKFSLVSEINSEFCVFKGRSEKLTLNYHML